MSEMGSVHVLHVCLHVLAYSGMSEQDPSVLEVPVRKCAASEFSIHA